MGRAGYRNGLNNGRKWSTLPDSEAPIELSLDPAGDYIQGPIKLHDMHGLRVFLDLHDDQMAALTAPEGLRAVYLEGAHYLEVGHGIQQIDTSHELFLLNTEAVKLRWTKDHPLGCGRTNRTAVIGNCRLRIVAPARFFRMLWNDDAHANRETAGELDAAAMMARVDDIARRALTELLAPAVGQSECSAVQIQSRLTGLTPEDLSDELEPWGLQCVSLAAYTAEPPVEGTVPETAGQLSDLVHN